MNSTSDLVGLIGVLLFCAGVQVLWLARHEVLYWVDMYLTIFRRSFDAAIQKRVPGPESRAPTVWQDGSPGADPPDRASWREGRRHASLVRVLCGVGLVFLGLGTAAFVVLQRLL